MIRILIADDHAIVRQGLLQVVARSGDIVVAGEASGGQETLQKFQNEHYDVILLDITLSDISGLEVLKEIKRQKPGLPVLIFSMHPEEQYAIRAIRAGASGYITKGTSPAGILDAIRKVAGGGWYISPSLVDQLASIIEKDIQEPLHQTLTDREYQVMLKIASGKKAREIASELFLGTSTIYTYRNRLLRKMQIRSDAEIIFYAMKNRLID